MLYKSTYKVEYMWTGKESSAKAIKEMFKKCACLPCHLKYSCKYLIVTVAFNSISFCKPVPLTPVRTMDIYDEQTTTMRVRWEEAEGATGYMLLYSAVNASRPTREQEVRDILSIENTVRLNKEGNQPTSCGCELETCTCLWVYTVRHTCLNANTFKTNC